MRVLIVSPDPPQHKGGIGRLVGLLKRGLEKLGYQITLVSPRIRIKELKFSSIPFRRYVEYDLIHLHGPTPFLSDLTLITNSRLPIVYTHHAEVSWFSEVLSKIYRGFHKLLASKARAIVVHSYDYARLFRRKNVLVIRMPCSFKPPRNFDIEQKPNPFTVLYVGQLRPFKGVEVLIRVASILREVNFIIVGEGWFKNHLINMAKGLSNVKFMGAVDDEELVRLYKRAHVICLPSINTTEAYGLVLIEGALYGCLPIASNLIGVRENVILLSGLLFEPGSHDALVKKIRALLSDRGLWAELAKRSQKRAYNYVNTYTPEYYVKKHDELFKRCLR